MKNYDVIFVALARWDGPYSSTAYSIAKEWSYSHRIFYVDNPFTIIDLLRGFLSPNIRKRFKALLFGNPVIRASDQENLIYICPSLVLPINWLPEGRLYNFLNKLNNWIFFRSIKKVIRLFRVQEFILFNSFNPFYYNFTQYGIFPNLNVYQSVDNINQSAYINKHGTRLEKEYVRLANLTITTSTQLKKSLKKTSKKVFLVPNAADFNLFNKSLDQSILKPVDFPEISGPVICYTGNVCNRIDYTLLLRIAKEKRQYNILIIGPVTIKNAELSVLERMENVTFLGRKDINELPDYLKFSDCAIIPFKVNELTRSIYPLKINEYLAAGKAVVSTNFSEDIYFFNDIIFIAENHDQFLNHIDQAVKMNKRKDIEKRVMTAKNNTWGNRVDLIKNIIKNNYE